MQTMVRAVEDVIGPVKEDRVLKRPSSNGKFVSVTLRDIKVQNADQVRGYAQDMTAHGR